MLNEASIRQLLDQIACGERTPQQGLDELRVLPFEDLQFAKVDHHRALRRGFPEVVYCEGKTPDQVSLIVARLAEQNPRLLGTRATAEHYEAARGRVSDLRYHDLARAIWLDRAPSCERLSGVAVVAAGTGDLPVAEEATLTLELMGHAPHRVHDVGVAGIHRLLHHLPQLRDANVLVVVAGMEGALPSVIGGMVDAPVIAVPTSIGYGASFQGLAALLSMLNACAPGIAVVNIDNGFGAGYLAAMMNRKMERAGQD